ncbi:MAG: glycosyltransferase family 39 protein [Chloroflexi bacterium]|nr:glycosyltransferase family 39 protein [Chloroflexota bacterium]
MPEIVEGERGREGERENSAPAALLPHSHTPVLILLAFLVFALAPLTAPGYFMYGHDARHSVYFLQMFDQSVQDGAWYPRWAADMVFGYGYPLWLILAPIPFFAGEAIHLAGFDFVSAVKIVQGLALAFSALAMYLFVSHVLNKNAALVAAIAYAYIPYHLADLYVRAAQAELVGFVFPPLVFWAFHQLAVTRNVRYAPLAALAYAGLLLSHMQTAVFFTPIIGLYLILLFFSLRSTHPERSAAKSKDVLRFTFYVSLSLALALALAAIFLLPILAEQKFLTSDPLISGVFDYRKHFVNASQLLSPFWGYGYAGENGNDRFSLQLGLVPVLLAFVSLWSWRKMSGAVRWHVAFCALVVAALVFLMLPLSAAFWEPFAAIVAYVQFPWRLLTITTFALAFLSGAALYALPDDLRDVVPALAVGLIFVAASYGYTEPQHTEAVFNYQAQMEFQVKDRELLGDTIWMTGPRPLDSPLVAQYVSGKPLQKAVALDEGATVEMLRHGGQSDEVRVAASAPVRVMFYTRFFPGWTATLDSQPIALEPYGEQGLILARVPAGSHIVRLRYEGTPAQQAGAIISGICLLVTLIWYAKCGK